MALLRTKGWSMLYRDVQRLGHVTVEQSHASVYLGELAACILFFYNYLHHYPQYYHQNPLLYDILLLVRIKW